MIVRLTTLGQMRRKSVVFLLLGLLQFRHISARIITSRNYIEFNTSAPLISTGTAEDESPNVMILKTNIVVNECNNEIHCSVQSPPDEDETDENSSEGEPSPSGNAPLTPNTSPYTRPSQNEVPPTEPKLLQNAAHIVHPANTEVINHFINEHSNTVLPVYPGQPLEYVAVDTTPRKPTTFDPTTVPEESIGNTAEGGATEPPHVDDEEDDEEDDDDDDDEEKEQAMQTAEDIQGQAITSPATGSSRPELSTTILSTVLTQKTAVTTAVPITLHYFTSTTTTATTPAVTIVITTTTLPVANGHKSSAAPITSTTAIMQSTSPPTTIQQTTPTTTIQSTSPTSVKPTVKPLTTFRITLTTTVTTTTAPREVKPYVTTTVVRSPTTVITTTTTNSQRRTVSSSSPQPLPPRTTTTTKLPTTVKPQRRTVASTSPPQHTPSTPPPTTTTKSTTKLPTTVTIRTLPTVTRIKPQPIVTTVKPLTTTIRQVAHLTTQVKPLTSYLKTIQNMIAPSKVTNTDKKNTDTDDNKNNISGSSRGETNSTKVKNICDACIMKHGVGYLTHPDLCTHFYQCIRRTDPVRDAVIERTCPLGLYWNQAVLTCDYPSNVQCGKDICSPNTLKSIGGNCRGYFECSGGISVPRCCPSLHRFDSSSRLCVQDDVCTDECSMTYKDSFTCDMRAIPDDRFAFEQKTAGNKWVHRKCPLLTAFSTTVCGCSMSAPDNTDLECQPQIYIPFDNSTDDESGHHVHVRNKGVAVHDGYGHFDGKSHLKITRFSNAWFGDTVIVSVRYKQNGMSMQERQALVCNGDCDVLPSLYLGVVDSNTEFLVKTYSSPVVNFTVPFRNHRDWQEVTYLLADGTLEGNVRGVSIAQKAKGAVETRKRALMIGGCEDAKGFQGLIDQISIYLCKPKVR